MTGFIIGLFVGALAAFVAAERDCRAEYRRGFTAGKIETTRAWIAAATMALEKRK